MTTIPTFDEYDRVIEELLYTLKYAKFSKIVLNAIENILDGLMKFLTRHNWSVALGGNSKNLVLPVIVILIILVTVILILFIFFKKRRKKHHVGSILGEKIRKGSTVEHFQEKSREFEAQGDYRQAMRLRFVAVLYFLHEQHYLYHDQSMTGAEMAHRLRMDHFRGVSSFEKLIGQFNPIWYGMMTMEKEQFAQWEMAESTFWQEVKV